MACGKKHVGLNFVVVSSTGYPVGPTLRGRAFLRPIHFSLEPGSGTAVTLGQTSSPRIPELPMPSSFIPSRSGRVAVVLVTLLLIATQIAPVSAFCGCGIDGPGCGCSTDDHTSSPCGDASGDASDPATAPAGGGCCSTDPLDGPTTIASSGCDTRVTERVVPTLGLAPERESVSAPVIAAVMVDVDPHLDADVPSRRAHDRGGTGDGRAPGVPLHILFESFRA